MARITNRAAAALGGKNEAAKNSSDFSFRKSQGPSQRLDFLFHYSLIEAELWEFFLKKSERQKRAQDGKLSSSPVSRTRVVIFVSQGFRSTD